MTNLMRQVLHTLIVLLVLAAAVAPASNAFAQNRRVPATRSARVRKPGYPRTRAAIAALEAARAELQQTDSDFGGHKAEAIDAINNTLKRLRLALQFEKY